MALHGMGKRVWTSKLVIGCSMAAAIWATTAGVTRAYSEPTLQEQWAARYGSAAVEATYYRGILLAKGAQPDLARTVEQMLVDTQGGALQYAKRPGRSFPEAPEYECVVLRVSVNVSDIKNAYPSEQPEAGSTAILKHLWLLEGRSLASVGATEILRETCEVEKTPVIKVCACLAPSTGERLCRLGSRKATCKCETPDGFTLYRDKERTNYNWVGSSYVNGAACSGYQTADRTASGELTGCDSSCDDDVFRGSEGAACTGLDSAGKSVTGTHGACETVE